MGIIDEGRGFLDLFAPKMFIYLQSTDDLLYRFVIF